MSYRVSPCALLSCTRGMAQPATSSATGTLTPRHQRHDAYSVRMPPTIRPIAAPPPASAPKTPNALARSFGSVKVTVTIDSAAGAINAAKAPCSPRAANSSSWVPGDPTECGGSGKSEQADDEGALAPGVVGDPATQQQQAAEGEGVGRDHPLPVGIGDAEVLLCRRQRDVDDRCVQHDHQLRRGEHRERPPSTRVGLFGRTGCRRDCLVARLGWLGHGASGSAAAG